MFSIIVPFKKYNKDIETLINRLNELSIKNDFELILLPDYKIDIKIDINFNYQIIPTNEVSPSIKRNRGAECSNFKYLVFIDADAYPDYDYFNILKINIDKLENNILGGPGISPTNQSLIEKFIDTAFVSHKLISGNPERYIPKKNVFYVNELPSMNMVVKKINFYVIGGFIDIWPGEDTDFCYQAKKKSINCLYVHELIVVHRRRSNLIKHIKQIFNYGRKRSVILNRYDFDLKNIKYFFPSLIVIALISSLVKLESLLLLVPYFLILIFNIIYLNHQNYKNFIYNIFSPLIITVTHISYGLGLIMGFIFK